jgi:hypothetical protein
VDDGLHWMDGIRSSYGTVLFSVSGLCLVLAYLGEERNVPRP